MTSVTYEQPREKLARKGVAALSNAELLQIIIGSGNAQASVAKIAKKVAKVLAVSGSSVHPQELLVISGVGKVKAGQILALFELAARFPALSSRDVFDSEVSFKNLYQGLPGSAKQTLLYATFDGAKRLIAKRELVMDESVSSVKRVQKLYAHCLTDSAASVFIALGYNKQQLEPDVTELSFVRDIYKTSQLLSIPVRQFLLVSKQGDRVLKGVVI